MKNSKKIVQLGVATIFLWSIFLLTRVYSADVTYWSIQVISYETEQGAKSALEQLKTRQFPQARIENMSGTYPFKLMVGRFTTKEEGRLVLERVKSVFPAAFQRSFTTTTSSPAPAASVVKKPAPVSPSKTPSPQPSLAKPKLVEAPSPRSSVATPSPVNAAVAPTIVAFEDLGYPKETHLSGSSPEFNFHLLNYKGLHQAEADMLLRLSNVLSEGSTLTVAIDGIPQFTKSIKEVGYSPRLSFPIPLSPSPYVKVTVTGHLIVTGDACEDLSSGNLWMVVSGKSRLVLSGDHSTPNNISDFFRDYQRDINILLDPEKVSLDVLPLFYYIHLLNDWKNVNVTVNHKPSAQQKTIHVGSYDKDIEVKDGELFVSEKKIGLFKKSLQDLYITSSISNAVISEENPEEGVLRLSEMGMENFSTTGSGNLVFDIPLRHSFFSGVPQNLKLELIANHTPIPAGDKAFLTVSLNQFLLKAVRLENGGKQHTYAFDIPEDLLDSYNNTVSVAASYFPNPGGCGVKAPTMTFSVSDNSRFYYRSVARRGIHSIVDVMGSLSGKVLLMIDDQRMLFPGEDLMHLLGRFNKDIGHIEVQLWSGQIPPDYDFVILLLSPENTAAMDLPLKLNKGRFSIVNPITEKNLLGVAQMERGNEIAGMEYKRGFGVLQTFDVEESKILLLSYYKERGALGFLKKIKMTDMGRLNGNVVLFNQNIASYTVGDKFRAVYQEARSVPYYLGRFKLPMVLVSVFVILMFLYYVNKKLVRG